MTNFVAWNGMLSFKAPKCAKYEDTYDEDVTIHVQSYKKEKIKNEVVYN